MSSNIQETIGDRIKKRRLSLGLTMAQVADEMGVSRMSISLWESGKTNIATNNLIKLAGTLKCSSEWLISGKDGSPAARPGWGNSTPTDPEKENMIMIDAKTMMSFLEKLPDEEQRKIGELIMERFDYYEKLYTELLQKLDGKK